MHREKIQLQKWKRAVPFICILVLLTAGYTMAADGKDTFFDQFVVAGGGIVYYVLIPMSIVALFRIFELCYLVRRKRLVPASAPTEIATVVHQYGFSALAHRLSEKRDLISRVFWRAAAQTTGKPDRALLEDLMAEALHDEESRLLRKVELCNIIGNVAPMVGLFGTVYGMIQAFGILGIAGGQPRPDELAEKISVALVTTFWGLLIAIPALALYGVFRSRIESLSSEAAVQVETLLRRLLPSMNPGRFGLETDTHEPFEDREESMRKRREARTRNRVDPSSS
ncbi:MAG: MotA/TolQ/ExbB proton channel family protein [Sedimentisphaerales bacterium]|nr:MotA/TolQ/ExbB proton channel family protein [Sedimentisphaerales bacterium]